MRGLELQMQAQLQNSGLIASYERGNLTKSRTAPASVGISEIRVIEYVQTLCPKLQYKGFGKAKIFEQRRIHVYGARTFSEGPWTLDISHEKCSCNFCVYGVSFR